MSVQTQKVAIHSHGKIKHANTNLSVVLHAQGNAGSTYPIRRVSYDQAQHTGDSNISDTLSQRQQHLRPTTASIQTTTLVPGNPLDGQDSPGAINARKSHTEQLQSAENATMVATEPKTRPEEYNKFSPPAPPRTSLPYSIPGQALSRGVSPVSEGFARLSSSPPPGGFLPCVTVVRAIPVLPPPVPFVSMMPMDTTHPVLVMPVYESPGASPRTMPGYPASHAGNPPAEYVMPSPPVRRSRTPTARASSPLPPSVSLPRIILTENNPFAPQPPSRSPNATMLGLSSRPFATPPNSAVWGAALHVMDAKHAGSPYLFASGIAGTEFGEAEGAAVEPPR
jgi:hypothetical protein